MNDENTGAIPFCFTHGTDWEPGCEGCEAAQPVSAMLAQHRGRYPRCRDWPLCGCGSVEGPVVGHYGDHQAQTVWSPAHYATGPLEGPGRWCRIYAPMIGPSLGVLYTNDRDVLGFLPVAAVKQPNAPHVAHQVGCGLREGAALGRPVSEVFDAWAARAGQGLAAGKVVSGDLSELTRANRSGSGRVAP